MTKPSSRTSASSCWMRALARIAPLQNKDHGSLGALIDDISDRFPGKPALATPSQTLTYQELRERKTQYANWALENGVSSGTVVCLVMGNKPDFVAIWIGLTQIGIVVALVNPSIVGDPLAHAIRIAGARHVIVEAKFADTIGAVRSELPATMTYWVEGKEADTGPDMRSLAAHVYARTKPQIDAQIPTRLDDVALLIYTSGTTGLPKAARLSHYRVLEWSLWFAGMLGAGPDDRLFDCLPLYHSTGGVASLGAMLVSGGSVEIRERFSARSFWEDVTTSGSTMFIYIGELCRYLLSAPPGTYDTQHQLRLCLGNGLRADIWQAFADRFAIPRILEFYASTEGNVSLYNCEGRPGALGRVPTFLKHSPPLALIECDPDTGEPIRGIDGRCKRAVPGYPGEAIGPISWAGRQGPASFEGYTDQVASAGKVIRDVFSPGDRWFRTGDLMIQDDESFFYFVDRLGDTFRWKGENVSTTEVAEVLCRCQGISEAVVYGVKVAGMDGRVGMAAVTVTSAFSLSQLHGEVAARLPAYSRPMFVRVCDTLPKTGTFKPIKTELAQQGFADVPFPDTVYIADPPALTYRKLAREEAERLRGALNNATAAEPGRQCHPVSA